MKIKIIALLCIMILTIVWAEAVSASKSDTSDKTQISAKDNLLPPAWKWTADQWTGDDVPFAKIRMDIDKAIAQGHFDRYLFQAYEQHAEQEPTFAQALFGWGYAVYKAPYTHISLGTEAQKIQTDIDVAWALAQPQSPHSYEYTRLQFLITAQRTPWQKLIPVGKRLLKHTPNDYDVKFYLINSLSASRDEEDRKMALDYAQQLVSGYPLRASAYAALGRVYLDRSDRGDVQANAMAGEAFQKQLDLTPASAENARIREGLTYMIKHLHEIN